MTMEEMSRKLEAMQLQLDRVEAAQICANIMSRYVYFHASFRHKDYVKFWAQREDDILEMPWGKYVGYESVKKCYLDHHFDRGDEGAQEKMEGAVFFHHLDTPIIVVAEDGQVVNRTVTFADEVSADELAGAQNLLNRVLAGHSARDVRRSMDAGTVEALSDPLVQLIIDEVIECLGESESARAHSLGVSALLRQPEFSDSKALLPVIEVLEDDRVLLSTFDEAAAEGGPVMVRIGHENPASELAGVSIVACPYGRGESEGVVAVIGPTRMNYNRVISVMDFMGRALSEMLSDRK